MITYKQLTLAEIFENCQEKFDNDKYQFLSLLDDAFSIRIANLFRDYLYPIILHIYFFQTQMPSVNNRFSRFLVLHLYYRILQPIPYLYHENQYNLQY